MVANRLQEEAFGTLDCDTLKLLDALARRGAARNAERNLKIGTVLVRDYQGRRHIVTVAPEGYVWDGQAFSSLSAIARAITGTTWSGPRFFALTSAVEQRNGRAAHDRRTARQHPQSQPSAKANKALPRQSNRRADAPQPIDQE